MKNNDLFKIPAKYKSSLLFCMLLGVGAFVFGLVQSPERSWINFLLNNFYFTSLALGGLFFLGIQNVTNSSWSRAFTRISESLSSYLIVGFVFSLVIVIGAHTLYEWTHHEVVDADPILKAKEAYLNIKFFVIRICVFFFAWLALSKLITKTNEKLDKGFDKSIISKLTIYSVLFLVCFAFSYSMFSFDMIMSLEPHWFSTIFGIYTFSGLFVNVLAVITLASIILQRMGYLQDVINENHYHDLGKLLFGFSTFWAYIWFSQYLLIWYSNIPEETQYYYLREHYTWDWLFYANLVINWLVPFFALMTRNSKRQKFILIRVCIVLLIGRWLDLYLMIAPPVYKHHGVENPNIGLVEIFMPLGFAAIFIFLMFKYLSKKPLIVKNDPYLEEGIHLHQ